MNAPWWKRWITLFDTVWVAHWPLWLSLLLLVVLRLPNFSEPYWYGDEGIYLTIGQSLRHGERLYAEIIDHKTPLIYYLAMVEDQLAFRWLLVSWMLVTTAAFYGLVKQWWSSRYIQLLTVGLFVLMTTLPHWEGNIPNGELFVMGFVLVGLWFISRTTWWHQTLEFKTATTLKASHDTGYLFVGGICLSLGILTKVPGLFDAVVIGWASWLSWWNIWWSKATISKKWLQFRSQFIPLSSIAAGIALPIILSVLYFVARGSGSAYLDFGLLYNFRYAGSWSLPFNNSLLIWLFSLPGKAVIVTALFVSLSILQKYISRRWAWLLGWLGLTLFASTLSNRPYPHYFLQLVPPLALIIGSIVGVWAATIRNKFKTASQAVLITIAAFLTCGLMVGVIQLLAVGQYPTFSYYQNWWQLVTNQKTVPDYQQQFNGIMADNTAATKLLSEHPNPYLFIWGTNPMLYAQSKKIPTGRFTVSFHIKDFQAYDETMQSVVRRQPAFIIIMNDEVDSWPEFTSYVQQHYALLETMSYFTIWQRLSSEPL